MRRRTLLTGAATSALLAPAALAQPGPAGGPLGQQAPQPAVDASTSAGPGPAPGGPPSLDISFVNGSAFDPRITFTRAAGPATYFDVAGTMQTAGTNVPRIDYDPVTHVARGLLIEEARTNLLTNSGSFSDYTFFGAARTAAAAVAPDGTTTAVKITEDASASTEHFATFAFTPTANTTYTYSFYLKAGTRTRVSIANRIGGAWTTNGNVQFDLSTGTFLATSGPPIYSITPAGNGWYRVMVQGTGSASPVAAQMRIQLNDATGNVVYTGDGVSFCYAWGAQIEQGAFLTSYIPTTTVAVTRAVDVATMPVGPWFNAAAGSWAAEFILNAIATSGTYPRIVANAAGPTGPLLVAGAGPPGAGLLYDGGGTASTANGLTLGAVSRLATSLNQQIGSACLNGGAVAVNAGYTTGFSAITTYRLMGNNAVTDTANGYIRRVRYWPRALSGGELSNVTA